MYWQIDVCSIYQSFVHERHEKNPMCNFKELNAAT